MKSSYINLILKSVFSGLCASSAKNLVHIFLNAISRSRSKGVIKCFNTFYSEWEYLKSVRIMHNYNRQSLFYTLLTGAFFKISILQHSSEKSHTNFVHKKTKQMVTVLTYLLYRKCSRQIQQILWSAPTLTLQSQCMGSLLTIVFKLFIEALLYDSL